MSATIISFPNASTPSQRAADGFAARLVAFLDAEMAKAMDDMDQWAVAPVLPMPAPEPVAAPVADTAFVVGRTYTCRSACDYDTVFAYTVVSRTAQRMKLVNKWGKETTRGIRMGSDGIERCSPEGSYSMAPVILADRFVQE